MYIKTDISLRKRVAISAVIAGLILLTDLSIPLGVAAGVPYVVLILAGIWFPEKWHVLALALLASILIAIGYFLSPPGGTDWVVLTNRVLALFVVWLAAILLLLLKSSQTALGESEMNYQRLIKASPICIHEIELDGRISSINPAGVAMMGMASEAEICGRNYRAFVNEGDFPRLNDLFEKAVGGEESTFEFDGNGDNGIRHYASSFVPVRDEAGGVIKIMGCTQDITQRTRQQLEVMAKTTLLETVLEAMHDGIHVLDRNLNVVAFNTHFTEMLDMPKDDFSSWNTFEKLIRCFAERGDFGKVDVDEIVQRWLVMARDPQPREFERILTNGRALHIVANPLSDGGYVTTYSDVTAQKAAEQKILAAQEQLHDAIEGLDEGFVFFDSEDRLVMANSTFKQMYPSQQNIAPGTPFKEVLKASAYAGEVAESVVDPEGWIASRLEQHRSGGDAFEQQLSDGRWLKVSNHITAGGGVVGIRTDITELKESKARADLANAAKSEFLANMSHELRTPLNSIIGFSEMLKEETFGPLGRPENKDYVEYVNKSGKHLLRLIGDILDLSKIEAGEETLDEDNVKLGDMVEDCMQMVSSRSPGKDLSFPVSIPPDVPELLGDRLKIMQILLNLLSNAIKFTPDGGSVAVKVDVTGDKAIMLQVSDTGEGISNDDLRHVLEPFGQAGNALTRRHDGTGLGLTLVKSLVELHGGQLTIESELGKGTDVTIVFPPERTVTR